MTVNSDWTIRSARDGLYADAFDLARGASQPFTIKRRDVEMPTRCSVSGLTIDPHREPPHPNSPRLVLVDAALGYVPGNIRVVSHAAAKALSTVIPTEETTV